MINKFGSFGFSNIIGFTFLVFMIAILFRAINALVLKEGSIFNGCSHIYFLTSKEDFLDGIIK